MAKKKAADLVKRWNELNAKKSEIYEEQDSIVDELAKMPDIEVRRTGYRIRPAFEDSPVEYGHGPVREKKLVKLTKKEMEAVK